MSTIFNMINRTFDKSGTFFLGSFIINSTKRLQISEVFLMWDHFFGPLIASLNQSISSFKIDDVTKLIGHHNVFLFV